ncbi:hypothetical protein [Gordonia sp. CPCC 205333]|uniref:hypothetical protein n=1 Tax=Gordonia sp. CPCC 205333 TaxID=3140790 RepID=UPI003AF37A57
MSAADLEHAAEITKLARVLGTDEAELACLADVSPSAIREFRCAASDRLFASDGDKLKRIASAAKLVPVAVAGKAAALAFGPLLTAGVAGSVEPARGIAIANTLPVKFLAKTAIELDPRRCGPILSELPPKLAGRVAAHLVEVGEHITLGRFVGAISDPALRAAAAEISDADLLRVACLLEDRGAIDNVFDVISDRLSGVLAAAGEEGLWPEALGLLYAINDEHRAIMGNLAAQLDPEVLGSLVDVAHETQAWSTLLPVTRVMNIESLRIFATNPAVQQQDTISAVMDEALAEGMWLDLLPLAGELPEQSRSYLAGRIADLGPDVLDDLVRQTDDAAQWRSLLPLVGVMGPDEVGTLLKLPVLADAEVMTNALDAASSGEGLPTEIFDLVVAHGEAVGAQFSAV